MRNHLRASLLLATIALLSAGILLGCTNRSAEPTPSSPTSEPAGESTPAPAPSGRVPAAVEEESLPDLIERVTPAVVRIETPFGVGSGFIVASDGYIVTNNHVITSAFGVATDIRVTLWDGSEHQARIVGREPRFDLAVLQIPVDGLEALPLARLEDVRVGDAVIAIGYPLDLRRGEGAGFTVTHGIVSQKNRAIPDLGILGAVQTDAPINHGNSGGPLVNMRGEVVGVNTAIAPDVQSGGVAQGIGFAVGSDIIRAVYEELRETGEVRRALFGIQAFEALRPARARQLGLPEETRGIYIDEGGVIPDGPAWRGGVRDGDVVVRIGEYDVRDESELAVAMIRYDPGDTVDVVLYRNGERMTVQVTLGDANTP